MNSAVDKIVIVGAGQAGGRAAEAMRSAGFSGAITMIGEEKHLPYERPQLSKQLLADRSAQVSYLRSESGWSDTLKIDMVIGRTVTDCDATARTVATQDGRTYSYDRLLIATGTSPRLTTAVDGTSAKVQYLRSIEDALLLREHLHRKARVVVVGGGVIGLEAASAAAKLGCDVTVVENQPRLLARAFPKVISDVVEAKHRRHGVKFVFQTTVSAGVAGGVRLSNGHELLADVVLVGIGVDPSIALARKMGLAESGGIQVNAFGRTQDESIYCVGDVALQWSHCHERTMRIETWANAQNQAASTASNMIGVGREYIDPSWFWTDQYDLNIQVVGDPTTGDQIIRGDTESGKFSLIAFRDDKVAGAVSINGAKDMAILRRIAGKAIRHNRSDLETVNFDLRQLLKAG